MLLRGALHIWKFGGLLWFSPLLGTPRTSICVFLRLPYNSLMLCLFLKILCTLCIFLEKVALVRSSSSLISFSPMYNQHTCIFHLTQYSFYLWSSMWMCFISSMSLLNFWNVWSTVIKTVLISFSAISNTHISSGQFYWILLFVSYTFLCQCICSNLSLYTRHKVFYSVP